MVGVICLLSIYQTKLSAVALVILTVQQNEGYCDDDGGCVELDFGADVLVVMIVIGDYDGDISDYVSVFNTDTDDDDGGKKEGQWRRLLAARQPGKKESESVDLHARRFYINKVLTLSLS